MKFEQEPSREQLMEEIAALRRKVAELEGARPCQHVHQHHDHDRFLEVLPESEDRYCLLAEYARDVIWVFDLNLNHVYLSPAVKYLRGYTVEEAMQQGFHEILSPACYKEAVEVFGKELELELTGPKHDPDWSMVMEFEMTHKNGSFIWIESTMTYLRDTEGNAIGVIGISRDITGRKRAEEALRESEAKFRFLAESMNDIIWMADANFNITYESPSVKKILGYSPDERRGQNGTKLLTPQSREKAANVLFKSLEEEQLQGHDPQKTLKLELEYYHKNGSIVWMESVTGSIRDLNGRVIGYHGVSRDITQRKMAEEEIKKHREQLELLVQKRTKELSAANKHLKKENEVRKKAEGFLRSRESELKKKKKELEEINSTLKFLLKQRGEDKTNMETNIISNIKISVLPFLEKFEATGLDKKQLLILSQIKSQLKDITSPFIKKISSELLGLTTSEIQVAYLIKEGKDSKDIARILNVSLNTIITHRYNIRRKTGLKNNKVNLCSYLQTLE